MKKLLSLVLSFTLILSMGLCSVAYANDSYELPSIPVSHRFGEWSVTKEPTCTLDGKKTRKCSSCSLTETEIIPALGHSFGEWIETPEVKPSCTATGKTAVQTRTCTRCSATESKGGEVINALGHDYKSVVTPPTCTQMGYTTNTCSRCNDTYTNNPVPSKGHTAKDPVKENEVAPSHESGGYYEMVIYCEVCNEEISREKVFADPEKHTPSQPVEENRVEPTCTTDGSYDEVIYCTDCSAEISRTKKAVPANGHSLGEWEQTASKVEPTCTEAGMNAVETRECSACDYFETRGGEVINALGHDYESVVTPPTCTQNGYTTYTCKRGDDVRIDDYTDAAGHISGEPVKENVVDSTTTSEGSYDEVFYCKVCKEELSRKVKTIKKKSLIPEEDSGYETEEIPFIDTDTPAKPSQPAKPTAKVKKPKPTAIRKLKAGRKYFTVKWKKIKGVKGYQIQYSTNKKFKKKYKGKKQTVKIVTVKKAKATSRKINKLKTNKRYYVRIRTYKVVKGKRIYSKWSKVKRIKTKK